MKVVILAGGMGTRISEESLVKPKPMIELGDTPILWHIMKIYSHYGYNEFIICLGYKGYAIREYFANYYLHMSDAITFDFSAGDEVLQVHHNTAESWKVTLVDTGLETMTGGRIKRVQQYVGDEPFMLTYGDGVSDVNIAELVQSHRDSGLYLTLTAVQPDGRFGKLEMEEDRVSGFAEKTIGDGGWINGGFMVCQPEVFEYITEGDATIFERTPLESMAADGQIHAFKHRGFWQPMDTLREKIMLDKLWAEGEAPWKVW